MLNLLKADEVLTVTRNGKETKYNTVSSFSEKYANLHNVQMCLFLISIGRITICKNIMKNEALKVRHQKQPRRMAMLGLPWWLSVKEPACNGGDAAGATWRRKWLTTPSFLPGKSHGQKSEAGYTSWGDKRVGLSS